MGKSYFIALLLTLFVAGGVYWYQSTAYVCPVPLTYRIGEIDDSFGITGEYALARVKEAESLWEKEVNRDLFQYDDTSNFTIDFIYDDRQEAADSEASLRSDLDQRRSENEAILETVESLQSDFESLSAGYETRAAAYETRLAAYNTEVNKYNDRGGAPADVYEKLNEERDALSREAEELSSLVTKLNSLAAQINELSDRGNKLVESYNKEVSQYNNEFGTAREFTQGDYQDRHIRIYKFSSDEELVTVLAHEFGHALGIDHVAGTSSLMYYLLEDTHEAPILSADDLVAYYAACGTKESVSDKIRRVIREVLAKFK